MGYELHITRRDTWESTAEGPAITREEWQSLLANDAELECLDEDTAQMVHPSGQIACFFHYSNGNIWVKKPYRTVLLKMLSIAERLGARVIGDNEEVYSAGGTPSKDVSYWFTVNDDW
jgi:hypothetical protein